MLILFSLTDIFSALWAFINMLFLIINSFIYDLVNFAYQVFLVLAGAQIFTTDMYQDIAQKIYVVIGVVALFLVAYALLRAIADPDAAAKSDMAAGKIIPNLLKVIILIAFIPTIFNIAYNVQGVILSNQTIPKLVLGDHFNSDSSTSSQGLVLANEIFTAFLTPTTDGDVSYTTDTVALTDPCMIGSCPAGTTYQDMSDLVEAGAKKFIIYANLGDSVAKGKLDFNFILQVVCGLFMVYVFVSFCIDLGVRVVKLAYYQLIAPIPILTLLIPSQKKIFDNWKNGVLSTFVSVFVRLAIVVLGVYLIESIPAVSTWPSYLTINASGSVLALARVFVILGILMFMKQAPKLISDMFGLKEGSFKLGIGDKLRDAGAFGIAGAAGAFVGAVGNKTVGQAIPQWKAAKGKGFLAHAGVVGKAVARVPLNTIRFGSAGVHGYSATKDAKSYADFKNGIQGAEAEALTKASIPTRIKNTAEEFANTNKEMFTNQYSPVGGELAKYQKRIENAQAVDVRKKIRDLAKSNSVKAINANRDLTNFDNGSTSLKDAGDYLRSTKSAGLANLQKDYLQNYNDSISKFRVSKNHKDYEAAMKNLDNYNWVDNFLTKGAPLTEADRSFVHTQLNGLENAAESEYINAQAGITGSEINMEIARADRIRQDNHSDSLMKDVEDLSSSADVYKTLKANHDQMFKDNDPDSNINKLRSEKGYINAVEADRRNQEYKKQAEEKK